MLLKSMTIKNFRQFKGTTRIDFSTAKDKNVTIILGNNTYGKTTLLQAFNWCLYEKVLFSDSSDFLLNLDLSESMNDGSSYEVEVEIELSHNSIEYVLTRTQKYSCSGQGVHPLNPMVKVSYKQPDGQTEPVRSTEIKRVIDNILPEDLSPYFFFDTERVGTISTSKDVAKAVKGLLGLSAMENAVRHLGKKETKTSVIGKFYNSLDLAGDSRAQEALTRTQDAENRRIMIAEQLENCETEIAHYNAKKEQLDGILHDNQNTTKLQMQKTKIEKDINFEQQSQEKMMKNFFSEFNSTALQYYAKPLLRQAADFLREVQIDDKGIKDLTRATIEDIISRGICICGVELTEESSALEHLKELFHFVPPESIGSTVRIYKDKLMSFDSISERVYDSLENRYQEYLRSKKRIQEWNDEITDITEEIAGKENMAKYVQELNDIKSRLRDLNAKREKLIRDDASLKRDIENYQKAHDSLVVKTGKNREIIQYVQYAVEVRDWLEESYKFHEAEIRDELELRVNEIYAQMYHGHRRVVLDNKYRVETLSAVADKEMVTGESEGSTRVRNFAFIAGLVALAKEKSNRSEATDEVQSSEPYPLVMDAPFSNADAVHTANISRLLPQVAEQVIMFVMEKDWRYAEPVMIERIGLKYLLDKQSETYTVMKEVK